MKKKGSLDERRKRIKEWTLRLEKIAFVKM